MDASHVADNRFHHDAADRALEFLKGLIERTDVVIRKRERELREFFRNARRTRNAERRHPGSSFHEQSVGVSVIAALKLHNVFALGIGARQADGRHGRFGSRTDKANFLHVRKGGNHQLSKIRFCGSGSSEAGALTRRRDHRLNDSGRRVPKDERAPRPDVVHILIAIRVPNVRTLAAHDVQRLASHRTKGAHRGVHSSGNKLFSAFLQLAGLFCLAAHHSSTAAIAKSGSLSYSDQYNSGGAMVPSASTAVATPCQTESNSSDFHKIAIFLQSVAVILMPVALLTGRVYQDGLGGLRAVLFIFLPGLVATQSQARVRLGQPLLAISRSVEDERMRSCINHG